MRIVRRVNLVYPLRDDTHIPPPISANASAWCACGSSPRNAADMTAANSGRRLLKKPGTRNASAASCALAMAFRARPVLPRMPTGTGDVGYRVRAGGANQQVEGFGRNGLPLGYARSIAGKAALKIGVDGHIHRRHHLVLAVVDVG